MVGPRFMYYDVEMFLLLLACVNVELSQNALGSPVAAPVDVFVAGVPASVNNYRIPALVRTRNGTLVAFAEARMYDDDCRHKYLVARRSVDNGATWSAQVNVVGQNLSAAYTAGNPQVVYDNVSSTIVVQYAIGRYPDACNPCLSTMQLTDGGSDGQWWGNLRNLSDVLGKWDGALPGPGSATQLQEGPHAGRLVFIAHAGAYTNDIVYYSDDHGASYTLSQTVIPRVDEGVVVELANGSLLANMRNDHLTSCDCRAESASNDGGATFGPLTFSPELVSPVCQASMVRIAGALYFSNPASTQVRENLTVRRSDDDGRTWPASLLVSPGKLWGGYSCMASGDPISAGFGGILYERYNDTVAVISFSVFPLKF
eukprot:TRINITY_DN2502_c0_g1_i4.p1 TRINITY_DN2502_c0_g1~~TRINITY_DN2502_c0_g1_i4.p1  ORF type:complete len:371 (+),score=108.22 TRINITY_DN2502_c0_g1_i4:1924-3036(+)